MDKYDSGSAITSRLLKPGNEELRADALHARVRPVVGVLDSDGGAATYAITLEVQHIY
jgi:hypothetical protein